MGIFNCFHSYLLTLATFQGTGLGSAIALQLPLGWPSRSNIRSHSGITPGFPPTTRLALTLLSPSSLSFPLPSLFRNSCPSLSVGDEQSCSLLATASQPMIPVARLLRCFDSPPLLLVCDAIYSLPRTTHREINAAHCQLADDASGFLLSHSLLITPFLVSWRWSGRSRRWLEAELFGHNALGNCHWSLTLIIASWLMTQAASRILSLLSIPSFVVV